ncbi:MAG TPA: efflux RND transporter periplasmic adaptor subunit [Polyangiaceae bacterium]|nr:efflux RND transporter periplasmic adaptor subunit [Polyangiaceae bacterium]
MSAPNTAWKAIGTLGIVLAAAAAAGVAPRLKRREALARAEQALARPRKVRVAPVRAGDAAVETVLPGSSAPFYASSLYAKSTGFLRKTHVDVGDRVKAGQPLAEIDAPETAEEVRLAQARLDEARANVGLAQATAERAGSLVAAGALPPQQGDDARAQANSALASVATRQAELQRLRVLRGYQQIVAPFDGVITRRGADPGALVGPAAAGDAPLFEIAAVETLRVFVDVPDAYAADVRPGLEAQVFSPRDPARKLSGKVARASGVLEPATRTLRAEIHVPGGDVILPGAFVYVRLTVPRSRPAPVVPAGALVIRKEGTLVATVGPEGRVELKPVALGRDFGKEIEVLDGVAAGAQVVVNPPDDLESGQPVEVAPAKG